MPDSILDLTPSPADERLRYGSAPQQFIDARFPSRKPLAALMNIHGGFWRARYDLVHAGHFCAALTAASFATFNLEYRRVGDQGGGWPGSFEDVRRAWVFLQGRAEEFGFDAVRMMVVGHSAGAQLALALAAHDSSVTRAVSLAGVLDLDRAFELHLSNDAVVEFLGGTPPQVPEHYSEASPAKLHIAARQVIVTGSADDTVPPEISRDYADAKRKAGEQVELIEIAEASHFDLIDTRTAAFPTVLRAIQSLS